MIALARQARGYQARDLERLEKHFAVPRPSGAGLSAEVRYCTGAGKTVLGLMLAARLLWAKKDPPPPGRYTHVLFAGPSDVIVKGFHAGGISTFSDFQGSYAPLPVRDDVDLEFFLALGRPSFALRVTHQLLTARLRTQLRPLAEAHPHFAFGKLLFLDESHHAAAENIIGELPGLWTRAGGDVVWSSATPGRLPAADAFVVSRSLPEQMAERYAPVQILSQVVVVEGAGVSNEEEIAVPISPGEVAEAFARAWLADGRPKSVVRIKASDHETNASVLIAIARAVRLANGRAYIASPAHEGLGTDDVRAEIAAINREVLAGAGLPRGAGLPELRAHEMMAASYAASSVDVIIGIHTIVEGLDWPLCSHAYLLGIPRRIETIVQVLGRTTRSRIDWATGIPRPRVNGYPEDWQDRSKLVFLAAVDEEGKIRDAQSRQMLALCAYLATLRQWTPLQAAWRLLRQLEWTQGAKAAEEAREQIAFTIVPDVARVEILTAWEECRAFFTARVGMPSRRFKTSEKAALTTIWIERRRAHGLEGLGEHGMTLADAVRQTMIFSDSNAERRLGELFESEHEPGNEGVSMRRAMQKLIAEFEGETSASDPTEDLLGPGVQLTAEAIDKWGRIVIGFVAADGASTSGARPGRGQVAPFLDPYSAMFSGRRT